MHQISDPTHIAKFILGGNATFTIRSKKTGNRFTFKVRQPDGNGPIDGKPMPHFVKVLTGPDNTSDYKFIGTIFADGNFRLPKGTPMQFASPAQKAFNWFITNLNSDQVEFFHMGKCCRCGRALTVPESIESGIGPDCAAAGF